MRARIPPVSLTARQHSTQGPTLRTGGSTAMSTSIPIIDIADYRADRQGVLDTLAGQLHDALASVGFLVLTGHDVPPVAIERTFADARRAAGSSDGAQARAANERAQQRLHGARPVCRVDLAGERQ